MTDSSTPDYVIEAFRILAAKPAFKGVTADHLAEIAMLGTMRHFSAGEVLMRHGQQSDSLHLLLKGSVKAEQTWGVEKPVLLREQRPGDVIGEIGAFGGGPRTASVTALSEVETLEISSRTIQRLLRQDHPLMEALLRVINQRL